MHYTNPKFDVSINGFKFKNNLPEIGVTIPIPVPPFAVHLSFKGRCGGMVWAANDFFLYKEPIPAHSSTPPPDGDCIADYIKQRQFDSALNIGDEVISAAIGPGVLSGWQQQCIPSNGQNIITLRNHIMSNTPCPLVCFPAGFDLTKIGSVHVVLAIGHSDDCRDIYIYDPNHPIKEAILRYQDGSSFWVVHIEKSGIYIPQAQYYAWLPDKDYSKKDPRGIVDKGQGPLIDYSNQNCRDWIPPQNQDLRRHIFVGTDFTSNTKLQSCEFEGVNAHHATFSNCPLIGCDMQSMNLEMALLIKTDLSKSTLIGSSLKSAILTEVRGSKINFNSIKAENANFTQSNISDSTFKGAKTQLSHANFSNSLLNKLKFENATLEGCDMSNSKQSECSYKNGSAEGSKWTGSSLDRVDFEKIDLSHSSFTNSNLKKCATRKLSLHMAQFVNSVINIMDMNEVDISGAHFTNARLTKVNFRNIINYSNSQWAGATLHDCTILDPRLLSHILTHGGRIV